MSAVVSRLWAPAAALAALTYLAVMLINGALPERRQLVQSEAHGVLSLAPERITRVTVSTPGSKAVFARQADGWVSESNGPAVSTPPAETLDRAVKFMHTANPVRILEPDEVADTDLAEYGLDEPELSIKLETADGVVLAASFGRPNADDLLQYMRVEGRDELYLMSGFVGRQWQAVAKATKP